MKKKKICTMCGTFESPKTMTKGSILIELVLWLCGLIPGLIYSIWRHQTRVPVCSNCQSTAIIDINTPAGKKLYKEYISDDEKSFAAAVKQ